MNRALPPLKTLFRFLARPFQRLGTRIIIPYAVLTLFLAMVATYLVTSVVAGSLQERFDNQLIEAGRVASDGFVRQEREQVRVVRAMAFTDGVPEAIEQHDEATLRRLLVPLLANEHVQRADVVDAGGSSLLALQAAEDQRTQYANAAPGDTNAWGIVQQVLAGGDALGDKYAAMVETGEGFFFFFTAAPVKIDGRTVGAVLVGTDAASVAALVKAEALADVTIYDYHGQPIASTFSQTDESAAEANLGLSETQVDEIAGSSGSTLRESRSLFQRDYDVAYGLLRIRRDVVGLYSVALPTDFIFAAGVTTRLQMSVVFGLAIAAVLVTGFVLAKRITAPILRLVKTAQRLASGDLSARSALNSADEIGVLGRSFDEMAANLEQHTERLHEQHVGTVKALAAAIDARDPYTLGHSLRVGQLAVLLGRQLGLPEDTLREIEIGGYLHDIGKIGVRDAILLKPGPLTLEEQQVMRAHPEIAMNILETAGLSPTALEFVRCHHERLNGRGYPMGREGETLSTVSRIAAVADMYDAMTTDRPYRAAVDASNALAILKAEAGVWLDPNVVGALEAVLPEWDRRRRTDPALVGFRLPDAVERATGQKAA